MQSAFLRGREHHQVGGLAVEAEGPAAIALSRGGFPKTYSYTDPNEDCVAFALGDGGQILIAADGHHGELGSEAAVQRILEEFAEPWTHAATPATTEAEWLELALRALEGANHSILEIAGQNQLPPAPTTFVVALIRPADDLLLHLSVGDSHVFAVDGLAATDLGGRNPEWNFTPFLGYEEVNRETIQKFSKVGVRRLRDLRTIILATDGLSEAGIGVRSPRTTVMEQVSHVESDTRLDHRAVETCRGVVEEAMKAHVAQKAGDNMGCCVAWLGK